jgi:hypothetical protein
MRQARESFLAGDLEQPLHASERNNDVGGNTINVSLQAKRSDGSTYQRSSTFHSMWDDSLVELQAYSWGGYADAIDANPLPAVEASPYDETRIAAWANDSHALGIKAYQLLPAGTPDPSHRIEIGNDPMAVKSNLDAAMAKGAARLKAILEDALGAS